MLYNILNEGKGKNILSWNCGEFVLKGPRFMFVPITKGYIPLLQKTL